MRKKKIIILSLVLFSLVLSSNPVMAQDRFSVSGWSADYGLRTFWFRISHLCSVAYEAGEVNVSKQQIECYKIPDDNIYPPNVGNGSAIL